MMKYLGEITAILLPALLFFTGCRQETQEVKKSLSPITVDVQTVKTINTASSRQYAGIIIESQSISLSFLTTGNVAQVMVTEGQRVKKGQILAVLHSQNAQSILDAARAKEAQATDAYNRFTSVYKSGSLPSVKMVEMETNLQQAKSSRQVAEKAFNDCTLSAPSDGVIGKRMLEPGMNAAPEVPVFTLVKIDNVYARISVPEREISNLDDGQSVSVTIGALNDTVVSGIIKEKGVIADPLSRTYTVKIGISNKDGRSRPGMACSALVSSKDSVSSIVIPQYALLKGSDGPFCFVTDTTKTFVLKRPVKIGTLTAQGVIITDGLQNGESVVVSGFQKLSDSVAVVCR